MNNTNKYIARIIFFFINLPFTHERNCRIARRTGFENIVKLKSVLHFNVVNILQNRTNPIFIWTSIYLTR